MPRLLCESCGWLVWFFVFETVFHYVALAGLELDMYQAGLELTENPLPLPCEC